MGAATKRQFDLVAVGHGITDQFSRKLIQQGLLPEAEMNDGLILAETSLAAIPMLVTSDDHLLSMNTDQLRPLLVGCFTDADLAIVEIAHPRPLLRAIK